MLNNKNKNNEKNGFTLIELLVVVLIIGILAAIALPMYQTAVAKAKLSKLISVTKNIADAEERFYIINGVYTDNLSNLDIELPSSDYTCVMDNGQMKLPRCYNDIFGLGIYLRSGPAPLLRICYARTQDKDSPYAKACKNLIHSNISVESGSICRLWGLNTCAQVWAR